MPIKYNYTTNADKYAQLYRLQELLKIEHNNKGIEFKNGNITLEQFRTYQNNEFTIKSDLIISEINKLRHLIREDITINTNLNDVIV